MGAARRGYDTEVVHLNQLVELRLREEITPEELRDMRTSIHARKTHFKSVLDDTDKRIDDWIDAAERCLDFAEKARATFETGTPETRTHILAALGSNFLLKDKILSIHWAIPFSNISGMSKEAHAIAEMFEPGKNPITAEQLEDKYSKSSTMLRG